MRFTVLSIPLGKPAKNGLHQINVLLRLLLRSMSDSLIGFLFGTRAQQDSPSIISTESRGQFDSQNVAEIAFVPGTCRFDLQDLFRRVQHSLRGSGQHNNMISWNPSGATS